MRLAPAQRSSARLGFTLVELLAVIAIIAVLIGLTTAAVQKVRWRTLEVKNRHDISQLALAVDTAKTKYQVDYFPSRIRLRNNGAYSPPVDQLDVDSAIFLKKMWPRLSYPVFNTSVAATNAAYSLGWFPDDPAASAAQSYILSGDQCLVFFLGGIQKIDPTTGNPACRGFATNKTNPTLLNTTLDSPTYDFTPSRLVSLTGTGGPYSYIDSYGKMPFAFFSSWGGQGYNRYASTGYSDCTTLGVSPYLSATSPIKYWNPDGFQIISAGYDGVFGPGNIVFNSDVGIGLTGVGIDDMTNFHPSTLGTGLK